MLKISKLKKLIAFLVSFSLLILNFVPLANADIGDTGPQIAGLAASENFTCMNAKTGEVYCWGQSLNSNLGTGMETDNAIPHKVYGISDSVKVDAGGMFACSLSNSGLVSCWGKNDLGQVGDGYQDTADRIFPSYVAIVRDAIDLSIGDKHACALNSTGKVFCWGDNKFGQLGNISLPTSNLIQTEPNSILPVEITIPEKITKITSGSNHVCALSVSQFVYCWGSNMVGQLGLGLQNISISKPRIVPALSGITTLKSHYDSTCAKNATSGLYCWGKGTEGQLGETEWANRSLPRLMSGTYNVTNTATNVATSYTYANSITNFAFGTNGGCGIDGKSGYGYLVCWGKNTGYEPTNTQALDVVLGKNHGCIITITYTVSCWGSNLYGQTGANLKSSTFQSSAVLKGIPEWKNYITSWGISYSNEVATITWTGVAESKFALYVEPFGLVCEAASILNCQVGTLESNTSYKVMLIARGSTNSNSRLVNFSFTTGEIVTALNAYKLEAEKAEAEKAKLAKVEAETRALAKLKAYKSLCQSNLVELTGKIKSSIQKTSQIHQINLELLQNATLKVKPKLTKNSKAIIENNKKDISDLLIYLWSIEDNTNSFVCEGNIQEDTTELQILETEVYTQIRETNMALISAFKSWKEALLLRK